MCKGGGGLRHRDVRKALHGLVKGRLLLFVDVLDAGVEDLRIPLDLFHDVQQSSSHFVVPLHRLHSHVLDVLVRWRDDLDDAVVEGVADQRHNAR
jgi:hypothetical protein